MKKLFLSLLLLSLFFVPILAQNTKLSGIIIDSITQERIANAFVSLDEKYVTQTNQAGLYEFDNIEKGTYTFLVKADFYEIYTQKIEIKEFHVIEIGLKPANTIIECLLMPIKNLEEITINATRVTDENGVAYTNISKKEIEKLNVGQDLPILLNFQPSVVSTSDAGAGIGYTGIRIRGSDASRINVTINGIPVNDAESQGVFWVNMPDFASSVGSIQMQRGVGASTNGAGAFGGSINIQTDNISQKSFLTLNNSFGSFNTWKNTIKFGTGNIKNQRMKNGYFALEGRLSRLNSDGFIDRAKTDLRSYYLSGGYFSNNTIIKLIAFSGKEQTYQAWNGVPESRLRNDTQGMQNYIIRNGLDNADAQNLLNGNSRTYNSYTYNNEIDDYQQDNYQASINQRIRDWDFNISFHYTKGRGFFEQYRKDDKLENYNLDNVTIGNQTITKTDLIRRRWLDNDFYGTVFSANYDRGKIDLTFGGGWNTYQGKHFGEVIWAKYASNGNIRHRYYDNDATKKDFNLYTKLNYKWTTKLNTTLDIQYRNVGYNFVGLANDNFGIRTVNQNVNFNFFNPKAAISYNFDDNTQIYTSFSVGNKEPNRDDFTQSSPQSRPKNETLLDYEMGIRKKYKSINFQINGYFMDYQNQLVLTGQVNDVGGYTRKNIAKSYRAGVESEFAWRIMNNFTWRINATFSQNKIQNFKEFTDDYDNGGQMTKDFSKTDIAFSPNIIAGSIVEYNPFKNFTLGLMSKYVGKQYLDNTNDENRKLNAYFMQDIRLNYIWKPKFAQEINFNLLINNILNAKYESNGYTYNYISGGERIVENFYFPQAGTNFLFGMGITF